MYDAGGTLTTVQRCEKFKMSLPEYSLNLLTLWKNIYLHGKIFLVGWFTDKQEVKLSSFTYT